MKMPPAPRRMWCSDNRPFRKSIGEPSVCFSADGNKRPVPGKQRKFTLEKSPRTGPKCLKGQLPDVGPVLAVRQLGPKYRPVKAQAI